MKHLLQPQFLNFFRNLPWFISPKPYLHVSSLSSIRSNESKIQQSPSLYCSENGASEEIKRCLQNSEASSPRFVILTYPLKPFRIELISDVHGVEEAAKFLEMIPVEERDLYVYVTLLDCCETHNSLSIAETTFQKMRDLGFADNYPGSYITMLCLYAEAKDHDMVVKLLREMFNKKMQLKQVPFDDLLFSYALASVMDVEGMEKFLSEWEKTIDEEDEEEWGYSYFPGLVYIRAGYKEKGLALMRKTEQLVDDDCRELIYGYLMTKYCDEGKREDVYRLCNLTKHHKISSDSSTCSTIIKALTKISDLDEVLEDWDQYRRDMESAADILRLLNNQDQVLHVMDKGRLSLKMMEAMRGGGYIGGED